MNAGHLSVEITLTSTGIGTDKYSDYHTDEGIPTWMAMAAGFGSRLTECPGLGSRMMGEPEAAGFVKTCSRRSV